MNDAEVISRLRNGLNEATSHLLIPNPSEPAFFRNGAPISMAEGAQQRSPIRRRAGHIVRSRPCTAVLVALGIVGAGTGVAAASGAFDQASHQVATASLKKVLGLQIITRVPESIRGSFSSSQVILRATGRGPGDAVITAWSYSYKSAFWCITTAIAVPSHRPTPLGTSCGGTTGTPSSVTGEQGLVSYGVSGIRWHAPTGINYFIEVGQAPVGASRVHLALQHGQEVTTSVRNRWFVAALPAAATSDGEPPIEYFNRSGRLIGSERGPVGSPDSGSG
jgi:hypothetical protein